MERQEAEEEAEAVALNGGVEPGTVVDYMREEVQPVPNSANNIQNTAVFGDICMTVRDLQSLTSNSCYSPIMRSVPGMVRTPDSRNVVMQDASAGISPGGDSPGLEAGSNRPDTMQQQLHQVLSLQGLRDGLPD